MGCSGSKTKDVVLANASAPAEEPKRRNSFSANETNDDNSVQTPFSDVLVGFHSNQSPASPSGAPSCSILRGMCAMVAPKN